MKGKLGLAVVAVAVAMLSMPAAASAGHKRHGWCKLECVVGWMYSKECRKAWRHWRR
jgi:hypothetical protein